MTDAAVVGRILREYRLDAVSSWRRSGSVSDTAVGYEFRRPDGGVTLVRAYRMDVPLPEHFGGSGAASIADWLLGRVAALEWLAAHGYPAPRVVPTREGDPVGVASCWLTGVLHLDRPAGPGERPPRDSGICKKAGIDEHAKRVPYERRG